MTKHKKINEKANGPREDASENPPALTGTIEEVPVIQEGEQAKEEEAQKAAAAAYAALDEDVKHAQLKDTKDYAAIRRAMRKPEPSLLVFGELYTPATSEKLGKFFCYPPANAKGQKANPAHVQHVYKIGEDIGAQEAARLQLQYQAIFNKGKGGRPSTFPELVEEKALYLDTVRSQFAAVTGGWMPGGEFYDATQSRSVTTAAPGTKPAVQQQQKAAEGNVELIQAQGIAYKDGRYPLAAYLMTQLAGDTIAARAIAETAIALVLSRQGTDYESALYAALAAKATHPEAFAYAVINELKECFRALDPNVLRKMDLQQVRLENWQQKALNEETLHIEAVREKNEIVEAYNKRLMLALQLLPPMLKIEYEKAIGLADAFPEWAARNAEDAKMQYMQMKIAMDNAGPPAPRKPFQFLIDLKRAMREVKKMDAAEESPLDPDLAEYARTGQPSPALLKKYREFLEFQQQQQANESAGGSNI